MLTVVTTLFRAEFGHRWCSWMSLVLLVALVMGLPLAGVAAGRQTASALPRHLAAFGADVQVFSFKPIVRIVSARRMCPAAS
jgi:hypothetical protein